MKFGNLSVKARLLATMGILVLALIAIAVAGLVSLKQSSENLDTMYERRTRPVAYLGKIFGLQVQIIQELDLALGLQDPSRIAVLDRHIMDNRRAINENMDLWNKVIFSEESRTLHESISGRRADLVAELEAVRGALHSGDYVLARKLRMERVEPAFEPLRAAIEEALKSQIDRAEKLREESQAIYRNDRTLVLGVGIAALIAALWLAVLLIRSIMKSLQSALLLSRRIAAGQVGNEVLIESHDEFGALLTSLQQMDRKLSEIVGGVRTAADSVSSASSQLTQGNDDLSQRTQEQAAALEQTASSMEEMTATVKQNADNARQANQLAASARGQAERGGEVVARAIGAMGEINESSRKIADIIGVIDEIAFQTNLLALNAAVEAARAGEQGRGFAVVATEVRSLAQRSASAAKEIKDLINDSVGKVRAGSSLVEASGHTLEEIMESVKKVSDIVAEIAAASEEQAAGIEQVNNAVTQMDETTQQNAALVEEASAASKAMQMQAQELISEIAFFQNCNEASVHMPAVAAAAPRTVMPLPSRSARTQKPTRAPAAMSRPRKISGGGGAEWQEF